MDGKKFYKRIEEDGRFAWMGCHKEPKPEDDYVVLANKLNGSVFRVCVNAILENDWTTIEDVLLCKRPPTVMRHLSRIVGYYSFTYAWNKSKLAELLDRRKGQYTLPESDAPVPVADETPRMRRRAGKDSTK